MGLKNFSLQLGTSWVDVEFDFDIDISTTPVLVNNQVEQQLHTALQRVRDHNIPAQDTTYYNVYGYVGDLILDKKLDFEIDRYHHQDQASMTNLHIDMFIRYQWAVQQGLRELADDCAVVCELVKRSTDPRLYNNSFDLRWNTHYQGLSDELRLSASYNLEPGDVLLSDVTLGTRVGDRTAYTQGNRLWGVDVVVTPQDIYSNQITLYTGDTTYHHDTEFVGRKPPTALRKWGSEDFGYGYIRIGKFSQGGDPQPTGEVTDYVIK